MKRALFIDRDGTLIVEPPVTFQVDTLEQLEFMPGVLRNLYFIRKNLDFELVIVSNQDGLGTPIYPKENFDTVQNKMLQIFKSEGIEFDDILIDPSMPEDNSPNRKPRTGMLRKYMNGDYDLANSYVIGDRETDAELARNLGCKAIVLGKRGEEKGERFEEKGKRFEEDGKRFGEEGKRFGDDGKMFGDDGKMFEEDGKRFEEKCLREKEKGERFEGKGEREEVNGKPLSTVNCQLSTQHLGSWNEIKDFLFAGERIATIQRTTKETDIYVNLNLDGNGTCDISTGIGFFDHMLEQIGKHGGMNLTVKVKGDLNVDEHHTIEDTGIALGEALLQALGDKRGIERYGFFLPMDDCLCGVALDFGGRSWLVWDVEFKREKIGEMPTEMFLHFFKSLSDAAKMNLNIKASGDNEHHKAEGIFKAFARTIKNAVRRDVYKYDLPSTKGVL